MDSAFTAGDLEHHGVPWPIRKYMLTASHPEHHVMKISHGFVHFGTASPLCPAQQSSPLPLPCSLPTVTIPAAAQSMQTKMAAAGVSICSPLRVPGPCTLCVPGLALAVCSLHLMPPVIQSSLPSSCILCISPTRSYPQVHQIPVPALQVCLR